MRVNILTKGFLSPTTRGWLYPVVKNKLRLSELGINLSFYLKKSKEIKYCDIVIVESKFVREYWGKNKDLIFEFLNDLKTRDNKIFFYDLGDSTYSWVLEVLPYVDKLLKPFIFKNKANYCKPLNGCNLISDYYYRNGYIKSDYERKPVYLKKQDQNLINKIQIGFNSTFANHSVDSNLWMDDYLNKLIRRSFKFYSKLIKPYKISDYIKPSLNRAIDISCRMSQNGYSPGINFHRQQTSKILKKYLMTTKVSRKTYFEEIQNSKLVVSPFGWGEINVPRDYEVALTGSVLLKPNISHIDTWPNIFNKETIVEYDWNLFDLIEKVEDILINYKNYIHLAINLQEQFKKYSFGESAQEEFCNYFAKMLKN